MSGDGAARAGSERRRGALTGQRWLKIVSVPILVVLLSGSWPLASAKAADSSPPIRAWTTVQTKPPLQTPSAVSCPTPQFCVEIPSDGVTPMTSTDGGHTWTQQAPIANVSVLAGVSCSSASSCVIVGTLIAQSTESGVVVRSTDGGLSWSEETMPSDPFELTVVNCVSTLCVAFGAPQYSVDAPFSIAEVSTDSGLTWTLENVPSDVSGETGASCSSALVCTAIGVSTADVPLVLNTSDGGATWTDQTPTEAGGGSNYALLDLSCVPGGTQCSAVGANGSDTSGYAMYSADSGVTWSTSSFSPVGYTPSPISTASCPATNFCYALVTGTSGLVSTDGGATWTYGYMESATSATTSISCADAKHCVVIGRQNVGGYQNGISAMVAIVTADAGGSWTVYLTLSTLDQLNAIACTTATVCIAVGGNQDYTGAIERSSDGGQTWADVLSAPGVEYFSSVSCSSGTNCVAVGSVYGGLFGNSDAIATSSDGGASWSLLSNPPNAYGLNSVSCDAAAVCVALGSDYASSGYILYSADGGSTWSSTSPPANIQVLNAVSCPTGGTCVAVGQDTSGNGIALYSSDGGQTWTQATGDAGSNMYNAVSCVGAHCVMGGYPGAGWLEYSTDSGQTWTTGALPADYPTIFAMSCSTSTDCVAVGAAPSPSQGSEILTTADGGHSWRADLAPTAGGQLNGVSCVSPSDCLADGVGPYASPGVGAIVLKALVPPSVTGVSPASGPQAGGTSVTITGTGFTGTSAVEFGTAAASSFAVVSDSEVTASSPPGAAGNVDVTVSAPGGTSGTSGADRFSYMAAPPSVSTSSLPAGVVGEPYSTAVAATGGEPPYTWSISSGSLPAGLSLDSLQGTITGAPTSAGTSHFVVAATDSSGQSGTSGLAIAVAKATALAAISSVTGHPVVGQPVVVTVQVTGEYVSTATPSGSVTVSDGTRSCSARLSGASDVASGHCSIAEKVPGSYVLTATYAGDANFTASPITLAPLVVGKAGSKTTLTVSASSAVYGHENTLRFSVKVKAQYTGVPSGVVTLRAGTTVLCRALLSRGAGHCSPTARALRTGAHLVTAAYGGSAAFRASSATHRLTVVK